MLVDEVDPLRDPLPRRPAALVVPLRDDDPTGKIVNALAAGAAEAMRRRETVEVFQKPEELRALLEAAGV